MKKLHIAIPLLVVPASARQTITLENPLEWINSNIVQGGIWESGQSWLNSEYSKYFARSNTVPQPKQTATVGLMDGMPGMDGLNSIAENLSSFVQSIVMDIASFNQQAAQQLSMYGSMLNSNVASIGSVLETNSVVNGVLLPITNFQEFVSDARSVVTDFESQLDSELSYLGDQFIEFTSVAGSDINAAATDIGSMLTSLYNFVQRAVDILISSPLLTATTLINPAIMLITMLLASDPVKLVADYSAWQSEVSSRQSIVVGNYNSIYTFISTGLPQAENAILGLMSQFANFESAVVNGRARDLQQAWLRIANNGASDAVKADLSRLWLLSHQEVLHSASHHLQAVQPSHTVSADAQPIDYMVMSAPEMQTATAHQFNEI
ncbi:hypothetical protein LPJ78_002960 [Coemansia sp. RSA 989]|nr:hypothetical protein LPJ68_002420 [Coemansia sp. RSA 1086]KAJ1865069.1 hypothetical protein LPJ78_002960 [Coemansia sp. RSA 989]KAJ1872426.1 hypothetical protein LPJ55_003120 [Coemansia sp. RSA 990]KAJ2675341.1 hypothetical protein IWW42_001125 [Coemansia sp. RSA 1085]